MTDPAIEAARRAWDAEGWGGPGRPLESGMSEGSLAEAAASEALAPIRELHTRGLVDNPYYDNEYECEHRWPCQTAKVAYSQAELEQENHA